MLDNVLTATVIEEYLRQVQEEGGMGNFVIFLSDRESNRYVQVAAAKGKPKLFVEAVNNEYLAEGHKLGQPQLDRLEALGWSVGGSANFSRSIEAKSTDQRREAASLIERTLIEVYGASPSQLLEVDLNLE